jgi:pyruvyltransferase
MYKVSEPDYDIIHVQHKNITDKVVEVYPKIPKIATIHSEVIALEHPVKDKTIVNYIAIRPEIQNYIVNMHGIPEENIQVIYNPIDDTRFNTKGIKDDGYILFVGTIDYLRDKAITELSEYAEEIGKELWIVGEMNGGNIGHVLDKPFVKYFPSTNQVEKFVKNCSETAGILLGRTTIEGWMCGKPGWIFDVDPFGNVLSKEKHEVPEDVSKYSSTEIVKQIKQYYIDTLNLWWDEREDKIESESFNKLYFNGRKITPDNTKNWGDMIPYKILKELSKSEKLKNSQVFNVKNPMVKYPIISTGSVMHFTNPDSIVWGTGCIDEKMVGEKPKKIYAVRGPLTHQELELKGWECPEVYGDPALLYPMIYNPQIEKKHKWGFIPHYIEFEEDKDLEVIHHMESLGFQIIDVCSGTEKFVDELLECENVISSSLHGLIAADAYGIPNARVNVSNKLIGGDFKFKDYCYSVERELDYGYQLTNETTVENIMDLHFNKSIIFDREKLLESAPWNYEENKELF